MVGVFFYGFLVCRNKIEIESNIYFIKSMKYFYLKIPNIILQLRNSYMNERKNMHQIFQAKDLVKIEITCIVFLMLKRGKLKTITLIEALERVEYIYETTISEGLEEAVRYLNDYRNIITHHSISIDSSEVDILISNINFTYQSSIVFLDKHLPGTLEIIDQEIFELTKDEYEEHQRDMEDYYHEVAMSKIT